jgi:hypothetical protein
VGVCKVKKENIIDNLGMLFGLIFTVLGITIGFIPLVIVGLLMLGKFSYYYYKSLKRKPDEKENT